VFIAGLYVAPGAITRMGAPAAVLGIAIFVVPFSITSVVARLLLPHASGLLPLFLGLTISITALPVMGVMLAEFELLRARIGILLMNAALVNELLSFTVFAVLLRLTGGGVGVGKDVSAIAFAALSLAVFLGVVLGIHQLLGSLDRTGWWEGARRRAARGLRTREAGLALVMICAIGGSLFSQSLGLTFIVGAFYAGVLVSQGFSGLDTHWAVTRVFDAITWGFFLPLFFAFVGVEMDLHLLASTTAILLLVVLTGTAIATKVGSGYSVARLFGWSSSDSLAIGHLTSSRGAVGLAMAVVLLSDGVFSAQMFTVVAAVGLMATLVAPMAASRFLRESRGGPERVAQRPEPSGPTGSRTEG
jgi:Kef-type K+ transport system membrane component KefB